MLPKEEAEAAGLVEYLKNPFNPIIDEQGAYVSTSAAYANFLVAAYNEGCSVEVFNKDSDFENTLGWVNILRWESVKDCGIIIIIDDYDIVNAVQYYF